MKKLFLIAAVVALGWCGSQQHEQRQAEQSLAVADPEPAQLLKSSSGRFECDGRTHCSQMTSCAEAKFFIRNCPDIKMDGNNDGVPCESQWCN